MSRLLLGFVVAIAVICLLACGESSPIVDQPLSSETEQQSEQTDPQPQAEQEEAQQSEPDEQQPTQQASTAEVESPSQTEREQQTSAAPQPTVEQTQQQTQQVDQAEQPEEPAPPTAPVLRLWNHDGENPSGKFHNLIAPADHDGESPLHLVLYLPGRSEPGGKLHFVPTSALTQVANDHGVAVLAPYSYGDYGSWNAADGCCEHGPQDRDDVSLYHQLVNEAREHLPIDRLSIIGEYAGGWMAYRLACEGLPGLSAIAVLEASFYSDRARCDGARPLSVFHVHPLHNSRWRYLWYGGDRMGWNGGIYAYPGAEDLVRRWADRAGCDLGAAQPADTLSDRSEEAVRLRWTQGCSDGTAIELWGIRGSKNALLPSLLASENMPAVLAWLDAQAQVRDLDEQFQPGADPASRLIEPGVWTRDGRLEFLVLDTEPRATIFRPFGVDPEQPLPVVISLPVLPRGDVWATAATWAYEVGTYEFAMLLPGYTYRRVEIIDYLREISALAREHINMSALFVSGESGGAYEAYGYAACFGIDGLTGIIAVGIRPATPFATAGEAFIQECPQPAPISILHRIGTRDSPLTHNATTGFEEELREWAEFAGCDPEPERLPNIDVASSVPGDETEVLRWREGCVDGITVELWRAVDAGHSFWNPDLGAQLVEWMLNEARVES